MASIETEAYRMRSVVIDGKKVQMTAIELIQMQRFNLALKGNRLVIRELLQEVAAEERSMLKFNVENYYKLKALKTEGNRKIADAASRGLPEPMLLPHPDDIDVDDEDATAKIVGPETLPQLLWLQVSVRLRDFLVLRSVYDAKVGRTRMVTHEGETLCQFAFGAHAIDIQLKKRLRWDRSGCERLKWSLKPLKLREMEKQIRAAIWEIEEMRSRAAAEPLKDADADAMMDRALAWRSNRDLLRIARMRAKHATIER